MPLPYPQKGESEDAFVRRYMSDRDAITTYPDEGIRVSKCHTLWGIAEIRRKRSRRRRGVVRMNS